MLKRLFYAIAFHILFVFIGIIVFGRVIIAVVCVGIVARRRKLAVGEVCEFFKHTVKIAVAQILQNSLAIFVNVGVRKSRNTRSLCRNISLFSPFALLSLKTSRHKAPSSL